MEILCTETITFKNKPFVTLLAEINNEKYIRIGGESLQDALMTNDFEEYVSLLARFIDEGIGYYIPDYILESGDLNAIKEAVRKVDPELFNDEPEDEPEELTWDDIYVAADGCAYGEPNLKRKDLARGEIVCWAEENFGFNLEREAEKNVVECVEEWLDDYAERYNLVFDREGHLIRSSEITLQDKASELVSFYDDLPDRSDKEFDTLDIALHILREIADNQFAGKLKSKSISEAKSNKERVLDAVKKFAEAYNEAEEVFSEYPDDINDIISEDYPFEKSFDEYGYKMPVWVSKVEDAVFHKTIEENLSKEETESSDAEEKVEPNGVNDTPRKFEEHFGLTDKEILDIDDFSSEIRDFIRDKYEKRGVRLVDEY